MQLPGRYQVFTWQPKADITAFELAQLAPYVMNLARFGTVFFDSETWADFQQKGLDRHWELPNASTQRIA